MKPCALCLIFLGLIASSLATRLGPHIIGGKTAQVGAWPWQGSLQRSGFSNSDPYWGHTCGCALISTTWVLTAAHCVGSSGLTVVMGLHTRGNKDIGMPETYYISQITKHPSYNPRSLLNDIALIRLRTAVTLNQYVKTVPMAPAGQNFDNQYCYITGWGVTVVGGSRLATNLQEAEVQVYTQSYCRRYWSVGGGHICVGIAGSRGACNGDSGGPLVCKIGGSYHLAGLTSFGRQGCSPVSPSVYTRVSYYRNWIKGISGL